MEESTIRTMTVRDAVALVDNITAAQDVVREMATLFPEKADRLGSASSHLKAYRALINEAIDKVTITL